MPDLSFFIPPLVPSEWLRLGLLYMHLLSCAFALALVLSADWRILKGSFTAESLHRTASSTTVALVLLWVTGGLIIYHDTGFDAAVIAELAKLQLKLVVVVALTLNGLLLHFVSFPLVTSTRKLSVSEAMVLSITGTISSSHWLLAAFIGIARPLGQWPRDTLLSAYIVVLCAMIVSGIICAPLVRALLARRLIKTAVEAGMDSWTADMPGARNDDFHPVVTDRPVRSVVSSVPAISMSHRVEAPVYRVRSR